MLISLDSVHFTQRAWYLDSIMGTSTYKLTCILCLTICCTTEYGFITSFSFHFLCGKNCQYSNDTHVADTPCLITWPVLLWNHKMYCCIYYFSSSFVELIPCFQTNRTHEIWQECKCCLKRSLSSESNEVPQAVTASSRQIAPSIILS